MDFFTISLPIKQPTEFQIINEYKKTDLVNLDVDLLSFTKSQLIDFSYSMFLEFICEEVNFDILQKFIQVVAENYKSKNRFHNFAHAVCVQQFAFILISKVTSTQLTPLESINLLVCALCHDLNHPAVSNKFLNTTLNKLSILYGFQSTLERMHVATTLTIIMDPKYDFYTLPNDKKLEIYQKMTDIILVTDLANAHKLSEEIRHVPLSSTTVLVIHLVF